MFQLTIYTSLVARPYCTQGLLAIVDSQLHLFNTVNLATTVSRMAKTLDPADGLACAAQHPAFAQLKTAVSAPQAILCSALSALSCCRSWRVPSTGPRLPRPS